MLDGAEADALIVQHLGITPRAEHSRIVGAIMADLARRLGTAPELWRVVGLVHDLDYFAVAGDWSRHGLVATEWLAGRLPPDALAAIAAHDHRTGVAAGGALAGALRLADALAVFDQQAGRERVLAAARLEEWRSMAAERPFLFEMVSRLSAELQLDLEELQSILQSLPIQQARD